MMAVEIVGGAATNSLALLSDAGHMFTHFFALVISLGAVVCAGRPSCHHRTFGFYRMEILAAFVNSLILFAVTVWILWEGVERILKPAGVLAGEMFVIAVIGLAVNLVSALILYGAHKSDLNVRSAFVHMLADTVSSVVVVFGAIVIHFTSWYVIDPVLSIGIAVVIGAWGWELFRDSSNILLEAAPKGLDSDTVSAALKEQVGEIAEITDMHIWTITSSMHSLTAHVSLKERSGADAERAIRDEIKCVLSSRFEIEHATIEIE
jgi:cobalt-zinc-cadmium efflux system protein